MRTKRTLALTSKHQLPLLDEEVDGRIQVRFLFFQKADSMAIAFHFDFPFGSDAGLHHEEVPFGTSLDDHLL
jgi:hypothetical protein